MGNICDSEFKMDKTCYYDKHNIPETDSNGEYKVLFVKDDSLKYTKTKQTPTKTFSGIYHEPKIEITTVKKY